MNTTKSQTGSIQTLVAIAITLFILGVLSVILWKNFGPSTTQPITQVSTEPKLSARTDIEFKTITDDTLGTNFAIKYPADWTAVHSGSDDPSSTQTQQVDKTTLTSPSGAIVVTMSIDINGQRGGACLESDQTLVSLETDIIANYPAARYAAYISKSNDGIYSYSAQAQVNTVDTRAVKIGQGGCEFLGANAIESASSAWNKPTQYLTLSINFTSPTISADEYFTVASTTTQQDIEKQMKNVEYQDAKKIIQSLYVKN